jgi:hypothetical protein
MATCKSTCRHCNGEIIGPAKPTAPLPEIWLHIDSGGTSCFRVSNPFYLPDGRQTSAEPFPGSLRLPFPWDEVGMHPEGLDDL